MFYYEILDTNNPMSVGEYCLITANGTAVPYWFTQQSLEGGVKPFTPLDVAGHVIGAAAISHETNWQRGNHVQSEVYGYAGIVDTYEFEGESYDQIGSFLVDKNQRGLGVGAEVLKTLIDALPGKNLSAMVKESNTACAHLFEKFGFKDKSAPSINKYGKTLYVKKAA